ncbi:hypothetical protein AAFF_G00196280 [Aldrovandia affinis]|uniref:Cyclic GMP-AMP synthase n=1 Tax=Aldrovandia affinis TaxID=143900 RepID=A0AAD7RIZ0_9TELE|nr:hypothetical protein AAFF_G00196280 [Aldrovandia affinis]
MNRTTPQKKFALRRVNSGSEPSIPTPAGVCNIEENFPVVPSAVIQRIKQQVKHLGLRRTDRQRSAKLVNHFREKLLDYLKNSEQPAFRSVTVLNSGSYYEMVKINEPNEFDMMLLLPTPRLTWTELEEYHGVHYSVSLTRPTRSEIRAFLLDDELTISATRILKEMRSLVKKFISTYKVPDEASRWVLNRKRPSSPAVTLTLMWKETEADEAVEELLSLDVVPALEVPRSQSWPLAARTGLKVDNWLGKKTRRDLTSQAFYFVPKKPAGRNLSDAAKESWRISFSHIEKEIIKNHGQSRTCCEGYASKCCRKRCLMLLKCLIEGLKVQFPEALERLCSYHGKTTFLHTLSIRGNDSQWAPHNLASCFMTLLLALEGHACSGSLPHFFIPGCNLFAAPAFPRKALIFLQRALEEQKKQGLPLLQLPSPAPPLTLNPITPHPEPCTQGGFSRARIIASIVALVFCFLLVVAFLVR